MLREPQKTNPQSIQLLDYEGRVMTDICFPERGNILSLDYPCHIATTPADMLSSNHFSSALQMLMYKHAIATDGKNAFNTLTLTVDELYTRLTAVTSLAMRSTSLEEIKHSKFFKDLYYCVRVKFTQNKEIQDYLLNYTSNLPLVSIGTDYFLSERPTETREEGNGVIGYNFLGSALMDIREELRLIEGVHGGRING